jgi:hypothetical protein
MTTMFGRKRSPFSANYKNGSCEFLPTMISIILNHRFS